MSSEKTSPKYNFSKFIISNRSKIEVGIKIATAFTDYAINKSKFSFALSGFGILKSLYLDPYWNVTDYFNQSNGWMVLSSNGKFIPGYFFESILANYPVQTIKMGYSGYTARIFSLPIGDIGVSSSNTANDALFYQKGADQQKIVDFLVDAKFKELDSLLVSITTESPKYAENKKFSFLAESVNSSPSIKGDELAAYVSKSVELGHNRSLLLYGPPGTGKSTMAQYLISKLNYRTLRFMAEDYTPFIGFIFDKFKFDAIIIDDIDHAQSSSSLLLFLETVARKTKLILGTCNSLKEFNPAVIRPARFDEIIEVNHVDDLTIKSILGDMSDDFFDKVKTWPIAYINELVIRNKLNSNIEPHFLELQARVDKQLAYIKESKK